MLRSMLDAVVARRGNNPACSPRQPADVPIFFEVGVGTKETHLVPLCLPVRFEVAVHTATDA